MEYLNNLINLFTLLLSKGASFVYFIALFVVSGIVGFLIYLIKRFISPPRRTDE